VEVVCYFESEEWALFPALCHESVDFDSLNPMDEVVIRTTNSTYRFLVVDPKNKRGILRGGRLGEDSSHAVFLGSFRDALDPESLCEFRTGAPVHFYLFSFRGTHRLSTSDIRTLAVVPNSISLRN
jgi:hypothetical protein